MFGEEFTNPGAVGAKAELVHQDRGRGDDDDRSTTTSLHSVESVKARKIEWSEP